ncbi:MAG: hypothetical protein PHN89_04430 [Candidatus Pacebacteria bacterium]|nr:hypothetical protein [Candidatus Paceibacterota bacterium]
MRIFGISIFEKKEKDFKALAMLMDIENPPGYFYSPRHLKDLNKVWAALTKYQKRKNAFIKRKSEEIRLSLIRPYMERYMEEIKKDRDKTYKKQKTPKWIISAVSKGLNIPEELLTKDKLRHKRTRALNWKETLGQELKEEILLHLKINPKATNREITDSIINQIWKPKRMSWKELKRRISSSIRSTRCRRRKK